ncbi:hypothetical protein DL765_010923 [Monosporascus sp. GIB2]|nr:hypothetical protein DL765_010923 [Monosporascus sp. GIB2]
MNIHPNETQLPRPRRLHALRAALVGHGEVLDRVRSPRPRGRGDASELRRPERRRAALDVARLTEPRPPVSAEHARQRRRDEQRVQRAYPDAAGPAATGTGPAAAQRRRGARRVRVVGARCGLYIEHLPALLGGYAAMELDPGAYEAFNASVRQQEYASSHEQARQGIFYVVLALVFAINVACLSYLLLVSTREGGLVTDYTEPQNPFALVVNSQPSTALGGCCAGDVSSAALVPPLRVGYAEGANHYFFGEAGPGAGRRDDNPHADVGKADGPDSAASDAEQFGNRGRGGR